MKEIKKEYNNKELTIVWQPHKCQHSERCWRGLSQVFRYKQKPWIDPEGAAPEEIRNQINQCPSGALTYRDSNT